jgi:hypothetical protein
MLRIAALLVFTSALASAQNQAPTVGAFSGSGNSGIYLDGQSIAFNDPDGSIASLQVVVNSALTGQNSCYLYYETATRRVWLANDAGSWQGPVVSGEYGILQNSQCAVDAYNTRVDGNSASISFRPSITFAPGFAGTKSVWGIADDSGGMSSGWQQRGTFTALAGSNSKGGVQSIVRTPDSGQSAVFQVYYTNSGGGYLDLASADLVIGQSTATGNSCYLRMNRANQTVALANDAGTFGTPVAMGASTILSNSQCSVDVSDLPSIRANVAAWVVRFTISFQPAYVGTHTLYASSTTQAGASWGIQSYDTFSVTPGSNHAPTIDSISPNSGSAASQVFTITASDADGGADVKFIYFSVVTDPASAPTVCTVTMTASPATVALSDDSGLMGSPVALTSSTTLQNSYCSFSGTGSSITVSGNSAVFKAALSFKAPFATGAKTLQASATDGSLATSGWQTKGAWSVPSAGNQAPTVDSLNGMGCCNSVFPFKFSDANGAEDIRSVEMVVHSALASQQSCYLSYDRVTQMIYLADDAGVWMPGVKAGTARVLANSRCAIDVSLVYPSTSTTSLSINVPIAVRSGYGANKNIWGLARDASGASSGWIDLGPYILGTNYAPQATISHAAGGAGAEFRVDLWDNFGYLDIAAVYLAVGTNTNAANSCYVKYVPTTRQLYLAADSGSLQGPVALGSPATLENSRCILSAIGSGAGSSTVTSATLAVALVFKDSYVGTKSVYSSAEDFAGNSSGWSTSSSFAVTSLGNSPPSSPSVTPSAASGSAQAFTFTFTDPNGYYDIHHVDMLIGGSTTITNSCAIRFYEERHQLWLADDSGAWQGPVTVGTTATLSNSRCSVSAADITYVSSGPDYDSRRLTVPVTFTSVYTGQQKIYAMTTDESFATTGWVQVGSYTLPGGNVNQAPVAVSVSPASGTGSSQSFQFTFTDADGYANITGAQLLLHAGLTSVNSCYLYYSRATNLFYLANDAGSWQAAVAAGTSATTSNSQCTLNAAASSASGSGSSLTVTAALTFANGYAGAKTIFALVEDAASNSGWQQLGAYTVTSAAPPANHAPLASAVSPASGSGSTQSFQLTLTDADGYANITGAQMLVSSALASANSCYVYYSRAANMFYLANDAGSWQAAVPGGTSATTSNSQCTLNASGSSSSGSGNTLTVTVSLTFAAGYAGGKTIFALVEDAASNSGWQTLGSFTVTGAAVNRPPVAASVSPSSGSGASQTFQLTLTDADGYANITGAQMLVSSVLSSANSCYIYYSHGANTFYLANDAGSWAGSAVAGAATTLSNTQCTLNLASSGATGSANSLTVTVSLSFGGAFTGAKTLWALAEDSTSNSGWQQLGTFSPASGAVNQPPVAASVSPASGSGSSQTFQFTLTDANGYANITGAQILVNSALSSANSCYVYYSRASNMFYVANDAGSWQAGVTGGASTTTGNSRCTLNAAGSSGSGSGNSLTITVQLSFTALFAGSRGVWLLGEDATSNSGWTSLGSYTVTGGSGNQAPLAQSVTPASASGNAQLFTFTFSDADGYANIAAVQMLAGGALGAANACYLYFDRPSGLLYLANDAGSWQAGVPIGSASTPSNSQCTVQSGSAVGTGNTLTVSLSLSFTPAFQGAKSIWALAQDATANSGWQHLGSYTVQ